MNIKGARVSITLPGQKPSKASSKKERQYLTAISICAGIIRLIEENGTIGVYHQRGIKNIDPQVRSKLMAAGLLDKYWSKCPELPRHYSISFEAPDIMGFARASYPNPEKLLAAVSGTNKRGR